MKTKNLLIAFLVGSLALVSCKTHTDKEYLSDVLQNMNKVESVSYKAVQKVWLPGEKKPNSIRPFECYEHTNPQDTAIGSSYVKIHKDGYRQMYDGKISAYTYVEDGKKLMRVDDFTTRGPFPFRMVMTPFFYYTQSILKYAIATQDSIELSLKDLGNDYLMELTIHEPTQVEFFGKERYMPRPPFPQDPTSIYQIWISKANDLPYRYRREMAHNTVETSCSDFVYNHSDKGRIVATDYFLEGYKVVRKGESVSKPAVDMTGKKAPEWVLVNMKDQPVSLKQIKSKVVLLQLTGIGCGPCGISTKFLHQLREKYSPSDLAIVAVETWGKTKPSCEAYVKHHDINYDFLTGERKVINQVVRDYHADGGVPQFYIIGKDRTILKCFKGYALEKSDRMIENEIKKGLKNNMKNKDEVSQSFIPFS